MKDLRTMTRKSLFKTIASTLFVATAVIFSACGNDDEVNNSTAISDGKMDVAKGMVFKVNFADYNSTDTLQTRSVAKNDTLAKEVVELRNGLLAEVTIKKDTENLKHEATTTRALANDTYTMLAYRGGILRGELKGTVSGGVFTPAAGGPADMQLPVGHAYDFVLFNSSVTRNGNTLEVAQGDAATALIGRTTYTVTATPSLQQVSFNMQRSLARMKIKLTAHMDIQATTAATLFSINATDIPSVATYDASTGVWSSGAGASTSGNLTFPASAEAKYSSATYTSRSNEYTYFLPSTNPSKLKLKFTNGMIYNKPMANAELNLSVPTLTSMVANGSYIINVKLMYSYLYLMSDGTTGSFKETIYGGGTQIPIGVVVNPSNRLAVALKDANNGTFIPWYKVYIYEHQNYRNYRDNDLAAWDDIEGYKYTWDPAGSKDGVTIKATSKSDGTNYDFPAFYHAGNYGNELTAELATQGKTLSDDMKNKKWHLPSNGEWKYLYIALGFGNATALPGPINTYNWYSGLVDVAFRQVGGTTITQNSWYWSSDERDYYTAGIIAFKEGKLYRTTGTKSNRNNFKVRAFVYY